MSTLLRFPLPTLLWLSTTLSFAACGGDSTPPTPSGDAASPSMQAPAAAQPSAGKAAPASTGTKPMSGSMSATGSASMSVAHAGSGGSAGSSSASAGAGAGGSGTKSVGAAGATAAAGASAQAAGASGQASTAGSSAMGSRPAATSFDFPITQEKVTDQPVFNVTHPENLDEPGFLLPVIVWANGGCFRSDFTWKPLFDRWAKAGFVVLSLTGTGDENDIAGMLSTTTKTEHAALIDWVFKQNETGKYAGKLDLKRVVISGNSCGGVTALEVAADEERLAAVFVLSGSSAVGSVNTQIMKSINIPVGYIVGGSEDIAGANATGDYEAMNDGVPGMIVNRRVGDHETVSTDTMIAPEVAEIALNWMDLAVNGTKAAYDALSSKNVCDHCTPGDWTLKQKNIDKLQK